jgi:hypothetical protein
MLKTLGRGLLTRLLAYAVLGLGFWLLLQGFLRPNIPVAILGGVMIPVGMYLIVSARRGPDSTENPTLDDDPALGHGPPVANEKEDELLDSIHDPVGRSR